MSTKTLMDAVLKKCPDASPDVVLDLIVSCNADLNKVFQLLGVQSASKKRQMTFDSFTTKKPAKVTKTSATTVNLYTPEQVADANIFCSLIYEVLDPSVANRLAVDLNNQSIDWPRRRFHLFDREVASGHTSAIYTDDNEIFTGEKHASYQGRKHDSDEMFVFTPEMKMARAEIERLVREKEPNWTSSIAVVNKYADRTEKLDYHSDQLTHIGPKPIIAALSLGCTREFRLKDRSVPPQRPIYSVHVPHNSLIIMHAGCQERFKHCVPPANSVDPDPLLGTARISATFRMYRNELNEKTIPRCACNVQMVLRNTLPNSRGEYKYIWQCASAYQGLQSCGSVKLYTELLE